MLSVLMPVLENTKKPILIYNRVTRELEVEKVYGEGAVRWFYETRPGRTLSELILSRPWVSRAYGATQDTRRSARKIPEFIRKFNIPIEDYEDQTYHSFNDFFIRKFKPGKRSFASTPNELPAFAEARYFAWDAIVPDMVFPIKGKSLSAEGMLGSRERAEPFIGGPLLLARLCPVDYHRYHYPDDGESLEETRLKGPLHSVNPLAIQYKNDILMTNERHVSILKTKNFGLLAYVEVGATCVGKIVQTHPTDRPFRRGDEKGYFLFGGSTVIVLGEPGRWKPDADLLEQTYSGRECLVRLGERVATSSI